MSDRISHQIMRRSSWLILACAGLLHAGMLIGWRFPAPLVPYFFDATVLSGGRGLDFYSIYQAGYNARHGQDVYEGDPALVTVVVPYFTPYRYLPPVAYTVGAALSLLSPLAAYKMWVLIVELTLLLCSSASFWVTRSQPDLGARLAAMWLAFSPFYLELFMGQFSLVQAALILAMLLLSGSSVLVSRQGDGASLLDALWITSILWKINTVVFAPVLARLRRWRTLVLGGLVTAAVTLPYFAVFPAHWHDFLANNFGNSVTGHELGNLGFRELVYEALAVAGAGADLQRVVQLALVGLLVSGALILTFRPRAGPVSLPALLSLWLVTFFLASPQVWEHHYLMLLPAVVVAYRQRPGWLLGGIWLCLALPTPFGLTALQPAIAANHDLRGFMLSPAWQLLWQHASKTVPTVLLFTYFAVKVAIVRDKAGGIIPPAYKPANSP